MAFVVEEVGPGVGGAVRLGRPEQVGVPGRPGRAALPRRLAGRRDLAGSGVAELRRGAFRGREMDEFPVSER